MPVTKLKVVKKMRDDSDIYDFALADDNGILPGQYQLKIVSEVGTVPYIQVRFRLLEMLNVTLDKGFTEDKSC